MAVATTASGQKQITRREHHLDQSSSRGVELPGETHGAVEVAPDTLPLLPGWRAPVQQYSTVTQLYLSTVYTAVSRSNEDPNYRALFGRLRCRRSRGPARKRVMCVTYGEALLLAVSQPPSYGKMVPL